VTDALTRTAARLLEWLVDGCGWRMKEKKEGGVVVVRMIGLWRRVVVVVVDTG
jgi:hypothetical protein